MTFVEPFAGGAGSALNLLKHEIVSQIVLNDLDIRVYSAWKAILAENDRFLNRLAEVSVNLETWRTYREIVNRSGTDYDFELGFATYFINRTSRAGILLGSGPIGGYEQAGKWKLDARFYRETMLRRIEWLGSKANCIKLHRMKALDFLKWSAKTYANSNTFYFIDPPYVGAGSRLYYNAMSEEDHRELASFLDLGVIRHWVLTYDQHELIEQLYGGVERHLLEVGYSLSRSRSENEILVSSN